MSKCLFFLYQFLRKVSPKFIKGRNLCRNFPLYLIIKVNIAGHSEKYNHFYKNLRIQRPSKQNSNLYPYVDKKISGLVRTRLYLKNYRV